MESADIDYAEDTPETSTEHFMSVDSSGWDGISEDTPVPRIGDEYQAVLPFVQPELNSLQPIHMPNGETGTNSWEQQLSLAIPISWLPGGACYPDASQYCSCGNCRSCQVTRCITENKDGVSHHDESQKTAVAGDRSNVDNTELGQPVNQIPLPCQSSKAWTDDEMESFLLGLYIFGKNLVHVKKFVESKKMGEILSLYYGKFYMCDVHHKWLISKKFKGRKRTHGHHLLTGWRQHELLSRLIPLASDEAQRSLSEATRIFNEHGMSLEEYALTLKDIVGVKALVEAVGIGKGKYDLTSIVVDPTRGNRLRAIHSEIPIGKACSSLAYGDIVKFLTGDYRLSKTRSHDLFWEAVWPRLLARGWHSEQPKDQVCPAASKHNLMFLAPGVKKFSRKLSRGDHYFDSVSDVLNKVASDPRILELGTEHADESNAMHNTNGSNVSRNEYGPGKGRGTEEGDADERSHGYPRRKSSNHTLHLMKFTVIDTSLIDWEKPCQLRELRSLPMDNPVSHLRSSPSDETDSSCSKEQWDSSDVSLHDEKHSPGSKLKRGTKPDRCNYFRSGPLNKSEDQKPVNEFRKGTTKPENCVDLIPRVPKRKRAVSETSAEVQHPQNRNKDKVIKYQFTRRTKVGKLNPSSLDQKKSSITACSKSEDSLVSRSLLSGSEAFDAMVNLAAELCQPMALTEEKSEQRALIDLNMPQLPLEFEADGSYIAEEPINANSLHANASSLSGTCSLLDDHSGHETRTVYDVELHSIENLRRQSTRNRPLTARALEALESGFLNIKRRARGYRFPHSDAPRSSRRARRTAEASDSITSRNCIDDTSRILEDVKANEEFSSYPTQTASFQRSQFEVDEEGFARDFTRIH